MLFFCFSFSLYSSSQVTDSGRGVHVALCRMTYPTEIVEDRGASSRVDVPPCRSSAKLRERGSQAGPAGFQLSIELPLRASRSPSIHAHLPAMLMYVSPISASTTTYSHYPLVQSMDPRSAAGASAGLVQVAASSHLSLQPCLNSRPSPSARTRDPSVRYPTYRRQGNPSFRCSRSTRRERVFSSSESTA